MRPSTIGSECDFLDNRWLWPRKAGATICAITLPPTPGERGHRVLAYRRVAERLRAIFRGLLLTGPTRRRRLSSITRAPCRRSPNGGVVVTGSPEANRHRNLIITLAARHRLPAVYAYRSFVTDGGLISYGPDMVGQYRRAAGYIDRILKGEKPADLPVQAPTKYEQLSTSELRRRLGS